jgi:hypothetical protein
MDALSRSANLVQGYWFRVFGTMLLFGLIIAVVEYAVLIPLQMLGGTFIKGALGMGLQQIIATALSMVLVPLMMTGLVVLYYDLRVRKEGFDLQVLMGQIAPVVGVAGAAPMAPTPAKPEAPSPNLAQPDIESRQFADELPPLPGEELPPPPSEEPPAAPEAPAAPESGPEPPGGGDSGGGSDEGSAF